MTALGRPVDHYGPAVRINEAQDHGVLDLAAGNHTPTVTAFDKNPSSANYFSGLDYLLLSRSG